MLRNGDFNEAWAGSHLCHKHTEQGVEVVEVDNIQTPPGWVTWFRHGGPDDYAQPEARNTRDINPDRFIVQQGFELFTFHRRHFAGLWQKVEVEPGLLLRFSAWPMAWSNHKQADGGIDQFPHPDDPYWSEGAGYEPVAWQEGTQPADTGDPQQDAKANMTFRVGIDPTGGLNPFAPSVVWSGGWHIYNEFIARPSAEAVAQASQVTVFLSSKTMWPFKHNNVYWDEAQLTAHALPPTEQRGKPREQYRRTYVLLPPGADPLWAVAAVSASWDKNRYTVGGSADDAGIGDLDDRRIIAVNPQEWGDDLAAFYEEHYPGVDARQIKANHLDDLELALETLDFEELPPLVPANPPPPVIASLRPGGAVGYTSVQALSDRTPGLAEFHTELNAPIVKAVLAMGRLAEIVKLNPVVLPVYRHWVDDYDYFRYHADKAQAAKEWNDLYMPGLIETLRMADYSGKVFVESLNETYDYDLEHNKNSVDFDIAFILDVMRLNDAIDDLEFVPVVMTAGVGNPPLFDDPGGPEHWAHLFRLAQVSLEYTATWGYHAYWFADKEHPHLYDELGPWLQWRWVQFRKTLEDHGYGGIQWLFTESGPVGGTYDEGVGSLSLNPGAGWKVAYGDTEDGWQRTLRELLRFDADLRDLDKGDVIGTAHFAMGGYGLWENFEIGGDRLIQLGQELKAAYS